MKKVLVILLVSAFVSAFAFADGITFGAWGRAGYVIAQGGTQSATDTNGTLPDWSSGGRVGFNIHGTSANVGFDLNVDSNGGTIGIGDNARIWVKVADFLRFDIGKAQIDNLRGKIGNDWADALPGYTFNELGDEDATFKRFYPAKGIAVSLTPVEGLFLGAALDAQKYDAAGNAVAGSVLVAESIAAIQVGAGYTIKDVGQVRVQYRGSQDLVAGKQWIDAAFALTAIKSLTIDLGTQIPVNTKVASPSTVQLNAAFSDSGISITGKIRVNIGDSIGFGAYLDPNFTITGPLSAGLKLSLVTGTVASGIDTGSFSFLPYIKLGYSNGLFGMGVMYQLDISKGVTATTNNNKWSFPIFAEYWF
jgi:hypothetical protein